MIQRSSNLTMDVDSIRNIFQKRKAARFPADSAINLTQKFGQSINELLLVLIPLASDYAVPAQSGYSAVAFGKASSGSLYFGTNSELKNGTLNSNVHAEQSVVINALGQNEKTLECLVISTAPCGIVEDTLVDYVAITRMALTSSTLNVGLCILLIRFSEKIS